MFRTSGIDTVSVPRREALTLSRATPLRIAPQVPEDTGAAEADGDVAYGLVRQDRRARPEPRPASKGVLGFVKSTMSEPPVYQALKSRYLPWAEQ